MNWQYKIYESLAEEEEKKKPKVYSKAWWKQHRETHEKRRKMGRSRRSGPRDDLDDAEMGDTTAIERTRTHHRR